MNDVVAGVGHSLRPTDRQAWTKVGALLIVL